MDLLDFVRGKLSPTLVLALIRQLPLDSAYVTALRGGIEYAGWDRPTQVLADVYDAVNGLSYLYQASHSDKPKKVQPLPPYPRPGAKADEPPAKPDPLKSRLRGEEAPARVIGPGSKIPLPPPRP